MSQLYTRGGYRSSSASAASSHRVIMDALRGGLVIPQGMTGLASGAGGGVFGGAGGGGSIPSSRGKKHGEHVAYIAGLAATETPASKPGLQIPGQRGPLTSSLVTGPWWSPERLKHSMGGFANTAKDVFGFDARRLSTAQALAGLCGFLLVVAFLVVGVVTETRSRSGVGSGMRGGVSVGTAVTTGWGDNQKAGVEVVEESTGASRKARGDVFGGAFTSSWIQPSRTSGHEHARSKLYNIIAPSPPPPGVPAQPLPPAPMMDFQRWCTAAQVLSGEGGATWGGTTSTQLTRVACNDPRASGAPTLGGYDVKTRLHKPLLASTQLVPLRSLFRFQPSTLAPMK